MIYTVTYNPAIDYKLSVSEFLLGELNRTTDNYYVIGGKGINVSMVLEQLQITSVATGFVGGFTGDYIIQTIQNDHKFKGDFVKVHEATRVNVKLKDVNTFLETEINSSGAFISKEEIRSLLLKLSTLNQSDLVMICGSPAKGEASNYNEICEYCFNNNIPFVVDAAKSHLLNILKYKPLLVKPNLKELCDIFEVEISNEEEIIEYGYKLLELGARNIIISLGKDGSYFLDGHYVFYAEPIVGELVNSVGAGDSMVGGFVSKYNELSKLENYRRAVACATATAFSDGLAPKEVVEKLLSKVVIRDLS